MAMMTGDRPVVISVMGASSTSHQMNYTMKVPYSSMARTIQVITKQGGKITNVTVATMAPTVAPSEVPEVPEVPSEVPSEVPEVPSEVPEVPSEVPSEVPTVLPSAAPTATIAPIKESNKGFKPKKK